MNSPSMEGALVTLTGLASACWSAEAPVFDETVVEAGLAFPSQRISALAEVRGTGRDRERQRLCRRLGERSKTLPPGGAAWRG